MLILFLIETQLQTFAGKDSLTVDSSSVPKGFSHHLDSLRNADNLEDWLYEVIDFVQASPIKRVSFITTVESLSWRLCRNDAERLAWFYLLANQGYYQLYAGNILRSIEAYEKAYHFYFEKPLPSADVIEFVLKPLGNNYTRLGDYDQAFFIHEKSLVLAISKKDTGQIAGIYNNLAISARWKESLKQAEEYCEKGLQLVKSRSGPIEGLLLSTLSDILQQAQQWEEAQIRVDKAIEILKDNLANDPSHTEYWLMSAYQVQGIGFKHKGDFSGALAAYAKAKAISDLYFKGERKREKAKLSVSIGDVMMSINQPWKALRNFDEALSVLLPAFHSTASNRLPTTKYLYGENTLLEALEGKANCLLVLQQKKDALQCFLLSFEVGKKLRQEFFSQTAKQQQQKENRAWAELAIQTAYELWQTTHEPQYANKMLLIAENSKAQLLLDDMMSNLHYSRMKTRDTLLVRQFQLIQAIALYEREEVLGSESSQPNASAKSNKKELLYGLSLLQKDIKEKYPMLGDSIMPARLLAKDNMWQPIPDSLSVIEFFSGEQAIYIIKVKSGGIQLVRRIGEAQGLQLEIKEFTSLYFQQGPANMINNPQKFYVRASRLYRSLCDSIFEDQGRYLIIPDGNLGYLPFDALVTDSVYHSDIDRWPFLIRRSILSFAYSLQTWEQQMKTNFPGKRFTGFFISYDSNLRKPIPAVTKECRTIGKLVIGEFYVEKEATYDRFRSSLGHVNILHISTHSFLRGENNLPMLQLADGKFFLFELYGQSFQPQLVVLSACRTGYGMLAEGEGIISLSRGFTASGAGGIVAALWNMNDESTATLMGYFYQHLKSEKHPAWALRRAKLDWLGQPHDNTYMKLPYFWAGSVYAGSDQPIFLDTREPSFPFLWFIATGIVMLLLIWLIFQAASKRKQIRIKKYSRLH